MKIFSKLTDFNFIELCLFMLKDAKTSLEYLIFLSNIVFLHDSHSSKCCIIYSIQKSKMLNINVFLLFVGQGKDLEDCGLRLAGH